MSEPTGPESITLDDMEAEGQNQKPDFTQIKLEGDDVPEILRGKSINEVVEKFGSLSDALRMSENARKTAEQQAELALRSGSAPPPPPKPEEPQLTEEQLKEMYEEDPLKAIEYMNQRAIKSAEKNLEQRLGPLYQGTTASVEAAARAKYPDEFEVLGDEIQAMVKQVPNAANVMSNPAAWDDLIALVRGRSGNFEKIFTHRTQKANGTSLSDARNQQHHASGVTLASTGRASSGGQGGNLDALQLEIAEKMGLTPQEYLKWSNVK